MLNVPLKNRQGYDVADHTTTHRASYAANDNSPGSQVPTGGTPVPGSAFNGLRMSGPKTVFDKYKWHPPRANTNSPYMNDN